ncbi:unnamed protein product [Linum trigynum]|uniref:Uncharacterized protein n=1 Tax=Linum trigynum TaxID=586398 RepID=A0AAV2FFU2_9ROSI
MAGTSRASLSFASPPAVTTVASTSGGRFRLRPILVASSCPSFPSRSLRRKNYLRPKILKTLTKPSPTAPHLPEIAAPAEELELPVAPPPRLEQVDDAFLDESQKEEVLPAGGMEEVESYRASETVDNAGNLGGLVGKLPVNSVLKFAVFLLGCFVLETAVVVLFFGTPEKDERLRSLDKRRNLGSQFGNGDDIGDGGEFDEKVNEIRAMAREARKSERRQVVEGEQEIGIEKEVSERLVKLQKKLDYKRDKLPGPIVDSLGLSANHEDDVVGEDESVPLMFKKKPRFRSPSVNPRGTPKGFSGSVRGKDLNGASRQGGFGVSKNNKSMKAGSSGTSSLRNAGNSRKESDSGAHQESTEGVPTGEVTKSQRSVIENLNIGSVTRDKQETNINPNSVDSLSRGGGVDGTQKPVKSNLKDKKADLGTNIWWSKLSYVMAILMRRGVEDEGEEGLFVVRRSSEASNQGNSYTLAFQDRSDANNFCFLLESFFEGLGDFSADIVPLSVRELSEAMKSDSKKVIVVKKGQLKLYAGQPFNEVESALQSLIEENQSE